MENSILDSITLGELKAFSSLLNPKIELPFIIGKSYLIRTVTHIQIGTVEDIKGNFLIMNNGAWIADTGRFHDCLMNGALGEVEPFPGRFGVNVEPIIDFCEWTHKLPRAQK